MARAEQVAVIIPASNEAAYIGPCLEALLASDTGGVSMCVVVSANACTDDTVARARAYEARFVEAGHGLEVLDAAEAGKPAALNRAEVSLVNKGMAEVPRIYLDADVTCDRALVAQLYTALSRDVATYATGHLRVAEARSAVTRAYARIWRRLPFVKGGAVGAGCFAVNAAARARWDAFPDIISDDTFVRTLFAPDERIETEAGFDWPMVEGFAALVRVRRRQDAGVREMWTLYPQQMKNEAKAPLSGRKVAGLALRDPLGFAVYAAVHIATRVWRKPDGAWSRGR
ncbi:glycosyltransferase [Celeribacter sp.]|uniref:glycosyltransferase n=1 Tax=Celeribacter sp. TaxID=1890673 RepID=UPI003A8D87ED